MSFPAPAASPMIGRNAVAENPAFTRSPANKYQIAFTPSKAVPTTGKKPKISKAVYPHFLYLSQHQ